jgi:hypothetical protein
MAPDGTYQSQHGLLHQFRVSFQDGVVGQANAKSPTPPYRPGDFMEYTVTGSYPGGSKLKITKPQPQTAQAAIYAVPAMPFNATPVVTQPPQSPQTAIPTRLAAPANPGVVQSGYQNGPTMGMALNNAVLILLHNARLEQAPITYDLLPGTLWEVASQILEAAKGLESGRKPEAEALPY